MMNVAGNDCVKCANKSHCEYLLGYRTAWCKIDSLLENLTKTFYCGTIIMRCDYYEENTNEYEL